MFRVRSTAEGSGERQSLRSRLGKALAGGAALAILGGMISVPTVANAESNWSGVQSNYNEVEYAYVAAGETLDLTFTSSSRSGTGFENKYAVTDPSGNRLWECTIAAADPVGTVCAATGLTGEPGAWKIETIANSGANETRTTWQKRVMRDGAEVPGRIWANSIGMFQSGGAANMANVDLWVVNDDGYQYSVKLFGYNGVGSVLSVDAVGTPAEPNSCIPSYRSVDLPENKQSADCAKFRLFYSKPAPDLPASAPSADGELKVLPPVLDSAALDVNDLAFTPTALSPRTGTFHYSITPAFTGSYTLEIDTNGDGDYSDSVDRRIEMVANGDGKYSTSFDGLDGEGNPITNCDEMKARIYFDRVGEIHVRNQDVEGRVGGIEIVRHDANGTDPTIYWDDTQLDPSGRDNVTPNLDGTAGVDSTGGVHGWNFANNSWGNDRLIDNWTYVPLNKGTGEITIPGRCLSVEKTSSATGAVATGDTVQYSVKVTNTGDSDYTAEAPAMVTDDMSDVLDDATFDNNAIAKTGTVAFSKPNLTWTGALPAGSSETLTYSVTVTNKGDHRLANTAKIPAELCEFDDPACSDTTINLLPHMLYGKTSDPASGSSVKPGQVISYTLSFTNDGQAAGPIDSTDDLADVLDDGQIIGEPVVDTEGITATLSGKTLRVVGALEPGATALVTYRVTVGKTDSRNGNGALRNVLTPDHPEFCGSELCKDPTTVHERTAILEPSVSKLAQNELAITGGAAPIVLLGIGILIVAAGTVLLVRRRRPRSDAGQ
ncbi:DUF11 domain-containing protein [Leucobacter viscericola]|uniref:DUF11 domain-containing protein n=1 Tax=Leucobacter viscericola TaxID=2714935 RepID=A0A6G7XGZ6_9MICO|nr:DUF11 domain-containing protein [Leucobacter viscericola]QIK63719.1 DUF11 domain-containing protein [Leucobacter viscericola]